jgi:hypothetical protein
MNQLTLLVFSLVIFCYFGGKYCPSVLKQNKEILLGVAGGLVLSSFFGIKLEGHDQGSPHSHSGMAYGTRSPGGEVTGSNYAYSPHTTTAGSGLGLRMVRPTP